MNFFWQLHQEAWMRFVILSIVMIGVYAIYGQHHANPSAEDNIYIEAPQEEEARWVISSILYNVIKMYVVVNQLLYLVLGMSILYK